MPLNSILGVALFLALSLPGSAQLSPRVVGQIRFPKTADFSGQTWTDSFSSLERIMSREYPFTRWRRIDRSQKYSAYSARIAEAERPNAVDDYRLALREYIYSFPDGHVKLSGPFNDIRYRYIRGGFGFALTTLDDGRVVSYMIMSGSPAAKAAIEPGATILTLNGKSIKDAAQSQAILWTRRPVSTSAQRAIEQFRYLARASVGTNVDLVFKNPGSTVPKTVTLTAVDDRYLYLEKSQMHAPTHEHGKLFTYKLLASRIGYIAIFGENITKMPQFGSILQAMIDARVQALIIDRRHNEGGDDSASARIPSYFQTHQSFFEYAEYFDEKSGKFGILRSALCYSTSASFRWPRNRSNWEWNGKLRRGRCDGYRACSSGPHAGVRCHRWLFRHRRRHSQTARRN